VHLVPKLGNRVRDKFTHLPTIVSTPFRRKWKTRSLERKLTPPTHPSDFSDVIVSMGSLFDEAARNAEKSVASLQKHPRVVIDEGKALRGAR
jgi:hypothetical protein